MIVSTGAIVGFKVGTFVETGVVSAIAALPYGMISYKINDQWYSDPLFESISNRCYIPECGNDIVRWVHRFFKIPATLPAYFLDMIAYANAKELPYLAIFYQGSKAMWCNGLWQQTFSYYNAYQPLVDHFGLAYYLLNCNLGSDDCQATHALIIDSHNPDAIEVRVGSYSDVMRFIQTTVPIVEPLNLTRQQLDSILKEHIGSLHSDTNSMMLGMFEIFMGGSQQQRDLALSLTDWLDEYITPQLFRAYMRAAEDNPKAQYRIFEFERRIKNFH